MHVIDADAQTQTLRVKLVGFLSEEEMKEAAEKIVQGASSLQPGFVVLNDVSEFKLSSQEGMTHLMKAHQAVNAGKPGLVVRVTGAVLAKSQLDRSRRESGTDFEVVDVESLEDAERRIEEFRSR